MMMTREQQAKAIAAVPHIKAEVERHQEHDPRNHVGMLLAAQVMVLLCDDSVVDAWIDRVSVIGTH